MSYFNTLMAALGLAMITATAVAAADPVEGLWQTQADDGLYAHIAMKPCGAKICGTIERSFDASGQIKSPNTGKILVIDMVPSGGGAYKGQVWRPSNDKIYLGKMQLNGSSLQLSGCVAGGLFCSKQIWSRVQ